MKKLKVPKLVDPTAPMLALAERLFDEPKERESFLSALIGGFGEAQTLVVLRDALPMQTFPKLKPASWQPDFLMRVQDSFRPGTHLLHDRGHYYVLDTSSAFAACSMLAIDEAPRRVLDICSAPGGKAIFASRMWEGEPLEKIICNDVNRRRTGSLMLNLERCKMERAMVTVHDPNWYARNTPDAFDLVMVDAPCSGQSLLAKGTEGASCFEKRLVAMNASRQKRIIANAARCVAPGGALLYMTCTFAPEENEDVIEWLIREFPEFEATPFHQAEEFRSSLSSHACYRVYPHQGLGAGMFSCLLTRAGEREDLPELPALAETWKFGDAPRTPRQTSHTVVKAPPKPSLKPQVRKRRR